MSRRRYRPPSQEELAFQCDKFNALFPVGSAVRYYPVLGKPEFVVMRTKSAAYVLSGHTAVVFLEGKAGCVAIENCKPVLTGER
jgi:hypothetical protein